MRRFEFVEGSSAKFWSGFVEGSVFTVLYGRIGAAGQRKDKSFPTEEAAKRELDKKIAEKLREGYKEVEGGAVPQVAVAVAAAEKKEPEAPPPLPPRFQPAAPAPAKIAAATEAVTALAARLGGRSWQVAQAARRARRALLGIAGTQPAGALGVALDALMGHVGAERAPRLPLRLALDLLYPLDIAAFARALGQFTKAGDPRVSLLRAQAGALGDDELALRLGRLQCERGSKAGALRRWQALRPYLVGRLDAEQLAQLAAQTNV